MDQGNFKIPNIPVIMAPVLTTIGPEDSLSMDTAEENAVTSSVVPNLSIQINNTSLGSELKQALPIALNGE